MNTSRAGSNMPCSRIRRRRSRAASARFCSAAYKLFFKADVVPFVEPPDRCATPCDAGSRHSRNDLIQRHIRLLDGQSEQKLTMFIKRRVLPPIGLASMLPIAIQRCIQITTTLGLMTLLRLSRAGRSSATRKKAVFLRLCVKIHDRCNRVPNARPRWRGCACVLQKCCLSSREPRQLFSC